MDGAEAEKVPFPPLMGQELAGRILPGDGSGGSGAEVERGAKSVGGRHELKEQGREQEAEGPFQAGPLTTRDGEGHQMAGLF